MKSLFYTILCIFLVLFFDTAKASSIKKTETVSSNQCDMEVIIEVYDDTSIIKIPEDQNIAISHYVNQICITVVIRYYTNKSNIDNFRLVIDLPNTSLIPVKIPPPPPPPDDDAQRAKNETIPEIRFSVIEGETPFRLGTNSIDFMLEKCFPNNAQNIGNNDCPAEGEDIPNSDCYYYQHCDCYKCDIDKEDIFEKKSTTFYVYEDIDLETSFVEYKEIQNDTVKLTYKVCERAYNEDFLYRGGNTSVSLYLSDDDQLDSSDDLLLKKSIFIESAYTPPNYDTCENVSFTLGKNLVQYWTTEGKYFIAQADPDNVYYEYNEMNNILPVQLLPDLRITDIRVYKTPDNNVILSSTVTNKGNSPSALSKLDFYVEKYPRKFVARGTVPALQPNASYKVNSLVTWQYFSLVLRGRDLIVIADAENDVIEIDESDNEKRFNIPRNLNDSDQNPTLVTVSPNPFSSYVDFNYEVKYPNTDIKLNIYDQRGFLRYQNSKFHNETGNFKFRIYSNELNNGINGVYHYSFLLGRNNTIYFPSTGTIIKM
ncbi:CARDB domain-containing protein [Aquimarina litoralis]|uniref:CARDB domain-containing protein n=1 Tax=Aquimarina litoralis TaxID=584605 RepID=UPI001C584AE5|nr:CARDB domain-containing protein [Aquimarina litoralis]